MIAAEARRTLHRRATAPAVAALLLLVGGAISGCGFEPATDRINTIAEGANDRSARVDALGIRVLSASAGEGRLIGALANNTGDQAALTEVSGEGVSTQQFEPVEVAAGGGANLAGEDVTAVQLTGDFVAGQVIDLQLTFDTDETITLNVPVVKYCGQYTQVPSPSAGDATEEPSEDAEASGDHGGDATYLCDHPTDDAGH